MKTSLQRIGNSQGVIIPKPLLAQIGLSGEVEMSVERDAIVLRKPRPAVRAGWAEDSKAIAAQADDALVWPEFANDADTELTW
jgi:antitoxin MazE